MKPLETGRVCAALAALAFLTYAVAVLFLHQDERSQYSPEYGTCIPAAVSYAARRAPLGFLYASIEDTFRYHPESISVQAHLAITGRPSFPVGTALRISDDGNGIGCPIFASIAMRFFGVRLSSLTYGFLLVVGISTAAFLVRYRDQRALAVPLLFSALTVMLLTPLVTAKPNVDQATIGGIRYFVIAGILPTLHAYFEITERQGARRLNALSGVLLGLQVLILVAVILVRNGAGYLVGPLVLAAAVALYRNRADRARLWPIVHKTALTTAALVLFGVLMVSSMPAAYLRTGKFFGIIWHRAVIGYGVNPAWPFPGMRGAFPCARGNPNGGVVSGVEDANGQCFWLAYPPNRGLPVAQLNEEIYTAGYEAALRSTFFQIIRLYPQEAFATFLYYKPLAILRTALSAFSFRLSDSNRLAALLVIVQFAILALSWMIVAHISLARLQPSTLATPLAFCLLCSLPPYFLAWVYLWDAPDLAAYEFSLVLLGLGGAVEYGIRRLRTSSASRVLAG